MNSAVAIILVIAVVLVAGLFRDSLRTGAVTRWARAHGFSRVPKPEQDHERLVEWAQRFVLTTLHSGASTGLETTIAEHQEDRRTSADRWHTLAVTRVPGLHMDAVRITRRRSIGGHTTPSLLPSAITCW